MANSRDILFGATALHRAASSGALDQVDDLNMDILINTIDGDGRSAMGYALVYMEPDNYKIIPGFRSQDLPRDVLLSKSALELSSFIQGKSVLHDDSCVLQYLLISKNLPNSFVLAEWLDWANDGKQAVWDLKQISPTQADRFINNVDPVLMGKYLTGAKIVFKFAGNTPAASMWFAKVIESNQQQKCAADRNSG